ncbi:hypothetical protein ACIGO8_28685 [Streptomyces sp. NPDC053493]|uniref:hypothetical protein n=1 Tax=Streptomyces sp. NPDC053493 TaxID=3365705 RepID=UPI0037D8BA8A
MPEVHHSRVNSLIGEAVTHAAVATSSLHADGVRPVAAVRLPRGGRLVPAADADGTEPSWERGFVAGAPTGRSRAAAGPRPAGGKGRGTRPGQAGGRSPRCSRSVLPSYAVR